MVNEFLKYGGSEVRKKLLKIMNMIFDKRKYLVIVEEKKNSRRKVISVRMVIIEALVWSL